MFRRALPHPSFGSDINGCRVLAPWLRPSRPKMGVIAGLVCSLSVVEGGDRRQASSDEVLVHFKHSRKVEAHVNGNSRCPCCQPFGAILPLVVRSQSPSSQDVFSATHSDLRGAVLVPFSVNEAGPYQGSVSSRHTPNNPARSL